MAEYLIERLGLQGDGIASGPIYAPRVLPQEVVSGELEGDRINNPTIIKPSDQRVKPNCRHYKVCGGCALMHASDKFVSDWKVDVVHRALESQGISVGVRGVHTSPPQARRRAIFHGKRTKNGAMLGLYGRASSILHDVPECEVISPQVRRALDGLKELVVAGVSRRGTSTLTITEVNEGLDVRLDGGLELNMQLRQEISSFALDLGLVRLNWGDEVLYQSGSCTISFGSAKTPVPPGAFLQATREGESQLLASMKDAVGASQKLVDLFSGSGTFTLPLATGANVHAVEGEAEMLQALQAGWQSATGLKPVTTETRDLFRRPLTPDELARFDAIVIDPPRAGADAQCKEIAKSNVPLIGFVSCNPVSFARDAKTLVDAGFSLEWLDVVDQFRWSTHVEIAAKFARL